MISAEERLRRYVDATLEGVLGDLASTMGGRNEAVRDASVRLGVFVARGLLPEDVVVQRLLEAARANGYAAKDGEREARSTILRGLRYGIVEGTVPDELERILRDVSSERFASTAPSNGQGHARTNGTPRDDDDAPPPPIKVEFIHRAPPPLEEVRALWESSSPVDADARAVEYLRSRGIDPVRVDEEGLARLATGELPPWARGWAGRLLVPLYDVRGTMRSLVARDVTGTAERKSLAPGRDERSPDGYGRKELVMACGRAQRLLHAPAPARLVVCEGEIDFLVAASQRSDADESGALGLFTGSWSKSLAARLKDGSEVVIATDADEAGEKYAAAIVDSLKGRKVRLARWRAEGAVDVAKAGGLAGGSITTIDPNGWRSPAQRALELGADGGEPLPTGVATFDASTRGGLRARKLIIFAGPPGSGKTLLAVQLARHYCLAGHPVAVFACDEDADALLVRWGQQEGLARDDLEKGVHAAKRYLAKAVEHRPFLLVDPDEEEAENTTLEDVAARLQALATELGKPGVLIVDSIQTARVREHIDSPARTPRERAEAVVRALKHAHRGMGLLVIATSEVSRGLYRGGADPKINPLAGSKETSAIEYAAHALLVFSSVAGESDLFDVVVPKNRIGGGKDPFRLRLDRDRALFSEVPIQAAADEEEDEEELQRREEARDAKLEADAEKLLAEVLKARAKGAELKSRNDLYALAKGKKQRRIEVVAHLFATGRLIGGRGKPIGPPPAAPTSDPPQEDDG